MYTVFQTDDGIRHQIEATGLIDQVVAAFAAQLALVSDHQIRAQIVQRLPFVELAHDPTPVVIVGIPPEDVYGPDQAPIFLEGQRQRVLLRIGLQLLHQERRGDMAQFHRARGAEHVIPPIEQCAAD